MTDVKVGGEEREDVCCVRVLLSAVDKKKLSLSLVTLTQKKKAKKKTKKPLPRFSLTPWGWGQEKPCVIRISENALKIYLCLSKNAAQSCRAAVSS